MRAAGAACLLLAAARGVESAPLVKKLKVPSWNYNFPIAGAACVDGANAAHADNQRWVYWALPEGPAPSGGWPVWVTLVTDTFPAPNKSATCGKGGGGFSRAKPFGAYADPNATMASCFAPPPPPELQEDGPFCSYAMRSVCREEEREGDAKCLACATAHASALKATCTQDEINAICNGTAPSPSPPHHHGGNCDYDQEAGALWDQRMKQYLVTNGVAVVTINPYTEDSWDAGPWWWGDGVDKPFLIKFFQELRTGAFGKLNGDKVIIRGWSGGAQMVSWIIQTMATNHTELDMSLAGGVMLSGGSYQCYNDANDPTTPVQPTGSCQGCTEGGASHCEGDPLCSSCTPGVKTYCGQCCPRNFTEDYFEENPAAWSKHPPVFLAQTSKTDNHADLCACRNYYETLVAHGISKSKLVLMEGKDEKCFCIGDPSNPDAAGSPYADKCTADWGTDCTTMGGKNCCIDHTLGFASMVEPAVQFALDVTA